DDRSPSEKTAESAKTAETSSDRRTRPTKGPQETQRHREGSESPDHKRHRGTGSRAHAPSRTRRIGRQSRPTNRASKNRGNASLGSVCGLCVSRLFDARAAAKRRATRAALCV